MYTENETLILLNNIGKEGKKGFIPKGTEVEFIKAVDTSDFTKSFVMVKFGERMMTLPELAVKPKDGKTIDALKEFNKRLMAANPELKKYHHNFILRMYYKLVGTFYSIFVNPFKVLWKKLTTPVDTGITDKEKLKRELKNLVNGSDSEV